METLADRIERDGPLNALDAVGWVIRVAKHLESLHVHGVSHGGISLSAIVTEGPDRNAKGLMGDVRRIADNAAYHSPERVRGGNLSPADDTWALAVFLYIAVTGQAPFTGTGEELKKSILTGTPAPLAVFDAGDDDLQRVVSAALATDISKRLSAVKMFREQLEQWHPDPAAKALPGLEDEDEGDEDEARTVMHEHAASIWDESTKSGDVGDPMFAPVDDLSVDESVEAPRQEEETVMRELPAHIMAMAARSAQGSNPPPAPDDKGELRGKLPSLTDPGGPVTGVTQPARPAAPRPAAGAPAMPPTPMAPGLDGGIPPPKVPPPESIPPDDDDDEVRTIMRTSDHDIDDDDIDEDGDEARTVMREAPVFSMPMPGQPGPPPAPPPPAPPPPAPTPRSADAPAAFPPPSAGFSPPSAGAEQPPTRPQEQPPTRPQMPGGGGLGSAPDLMGGLKPDGERGSSPPTMALPSDGFAAIAAELSAPMAEQGPPPSSPDLFNAPLGSNLSDGAQGGTVPMTPFSGPPSGPAPSFGAPPVQPPPSSLEPGGGPPSGPISPAGFGAQPPPQPQYEEASPTSRKAVAIVSVLALVAAAAITYVVLRYRAQLNLPFSVTVHASPRLK